MAYSIGTQNEPALQIPAWMPLFLGRPIRLLSALDDYGDGTKIYHPGTVGILDAIQWCYLSGSIFCVCAFTDDLSCLSNVPLLDIEPVLLDVHRE